MLNRESAGAETRQPMTELCERLLSQRVAFPVVFCVLTRQATNPALAGLSALLHDDEHSNRVLSMTTNVIFGLTLLF